MLKHLRSGLIYLVKGNLNTLVWLLQDVPFTPVVYPTTREYYEHLSYLGAERRYVIFVTNTDRVTSRSNAPDAIPDVKFHTIDTRSYFFLVPDGLALTDAKPLFKKLAGGQYVEVDLSHFAKDTSLNSRYPINAFRHLQEGEPVPEVSCDMHLQRLLYDTFHPQNGESVYHRWRNQPSSLLHSLYRPEYLDRACHFCRDLLPYARILARRLNQCTPAKAMHLLGMFGYFLSRSFKLTISQRNGSKYYNFTANNRIVPLWKATTL